MKVLVVTKSRAMRETETNALIQLGHTDVVEAADGAEALAAFADAPPDLLLVNPNLPDMDGLTFIRTLRSRGCETPIIMCAPRPTPERVKEAIQAGATSFVVIPFTAEALGEKIDQITNNTTPAA